MKQFTVSALGGRGPKSTAVNFVKEDGIRLWCWLSNDVASRIRPGMVVTAEKVSTGKVETSYEKAGVVTELKVPRQQVFLGGSVSITAPESEPLPEISVSFADDVDAYIQAFDAKRTPVQDDSDAF